MRTIRYTRGAAFRRELRGFVETALAGGDVSGVVAEVLADVRERGDAAVLEHTRKFDGAELTAKTLKVPSADLRAARSALAPPQRRALREAIARVREFHRRTLPKNWRSKNKHGAAVGENFYPIRRVGLYIPGGNVPLVSTIVMTAVPAKLAGCPEIAVCTPPLPDGSVAPAMLAALSLIGVEEVYTIGGVQAVGAMAYGTRAVPPVDKIFGPGNAYVMEAKRQVLGTVGVDLLPGPSEVMVIADAGADPEHVALDLLAQAEHGSGKEVVYLATTSKTVLAEVEKAFGRLLPECAHAEKCRAVLDSRFLAVRCANLEQCAEVADFVAPEHLELQVASKALDQLTRRITTAGAILQGYSTPTVLGDFTAGPSHTLPTGRAARFSSGLQATDFMRRSSVVRYNEAALREAAPVVEAFAEMERLDAHGRSLSARLRDG